ncbi:alpha-amylase family glycosyl hydrolase [Nonlabens ponticola]|nr:alpha-amylase family glycosyl hydrolase [Nonlabens ponticola]
MNKVSRWAALVVVTFLCACQSSDEGVDDDSSIPVDPIDDTAYSQYGTPFGQIPDTEDVVMYEANLRAMSAGGDLRGVINRLDHIEDLGINVIWLMPIHPQGQERSVGSPYAIRDYKEVSNEYGDLEDLRELTDAAHSLGIAVIMDWVANHTAWDNEWIENKDWYTQDAAGNIVIPSGTNWQDVADLNFDNQEMRSAMIDAMKYWILEANIDGYRCDYADGVPADFWEDAWDELDAIPNRKLVKLAEGNREDHLQSGFDLNFGFEFYGAMINAFEGQPATSIMEKSEEEYATVPDGKQVLRYTTNHDESAFAATPIEFFGGKQGALAASTITIFMNGVPLIYSSQEVGRSSNVPFFSNSRIDFDANPDMLESYQKMIAFYNSSASARKGSTQDFSNDDVVSFRKTLNNDDVLIIANIRNREVSYAIPSSLQNTEWSNITTSNTVSLTGSIDLQPYEFLILD